MFDYLTQSALDDAGFYSSQDSPAITSLALEELVTQFRRSEKIIKRYKRRYPSDILKRIAYLPVLHNEDFNDADRIANWCKQLHLSLQQVDSKTEQYRVEAHHVADTNLHIPRIAVTQHGMDHYIPINAEFFYSKDYKELVTLGAKLASLIEEGAYVKRGEKSTPVENFEQALNWLMDEAKRGQTIQRYKGLGEMNPEQLWETTMDPNVRRMLQVTIEDAVAADAIFTTLMGDQVEPRRDFIELNALDAENIDI